MYILQSFLRLTTFIKHASRFNGNRSPTLGKFIQFIFRLNATFPFIIHLRFPVCAKFSERSIVTRHDVRSATFSPPFPFLINGFSLLSAWKPVPLQKERKRGKKKKRGTHTGLRPRHDLVKTRCVIMEKINRDRNRFGFRKLVPWLNRPRTRACERAHFQAYRLSDFYCTSF